MTAGRAYTLNTNQTIPADVTGHQKELREKFAKMRERVFTPPATPQDSMFYSGTRIAPFTPLQRRVNQRANQLLYRDNQYLTPESTQQYHQGFVPDIGKKVQDLLANTAISPVKHAAYQDYMNDPTLQRLIDDVKKAGKEHWEETVLPSLQHGFWSGEANNIGARNRALNKAHIKTQESLQREINKLLHDNRREAVQTAERAQERAQQQAALSGSAYGMQNQSVATNINTLQDLERQALAREMGTLAAAGSVGEGQQAQQQKEAAADIEAFYEPMREQERMLGHEAALVGSLPYNLAQRQSVGEAPPLQSNVYQHIGSALQGLTGSRQQQPQGLVFGQPRHAAGGKIKKRAGGGATGMPETPHQYSDQELQYMNSPEIQHLMAEQQQLAQPDPDEQRRYLARLYGAVGSADPANPHRDFARAVTDAQKEQLEHQTARSNRSQQIADAIQRSRVDQVKMMHLYEHNRHEHLRKLSKDQRDNARAMSKEAREMEEHAWKRAEKGGGYGGYGGGFGGGMRKKLSPEDRKRLEEARENMKSLEGLIPDLEIIHKTSDPEGEHYVETGGFYENHLPEWLQSQWWRAQLGKGDQKDIADQDRAMKSLPIKMAEQMQRGRLGIGTIRAQQEAKMRNTDEPGSVHESSGNTLQKVRRDYKKEELVWKAHQKYDMTPTDAEGLWDAYEQAVESYPDLTVSQFLDLWHGVPPEGLEGSESEGTPSSDAPRKKRGELSIQDLNEKYANYSLDQLKSMRKE